jgi:N6-adenosine-specific RNA methylase IME4
MAMCGVSTSEAQLSVLTERLLDMYARKRRPGWTSWSNDLEAELGNERENVFGNKPENRIQPAFHAG